MVQDNYLNYNLTLDEFRAMLIEELRPKAEVFYDADEGISEEDE